MAKHQLAPWENEKANGWLATNEAWLRLLNLVKKTLENDPRRFPHQVRAAAAFVIIMCREGFWPSKGGLRERDAIVGLAKRQLAIVRQLYAFESRSKPELMSDPGFKSILKALDEEMRMLDARMTEEALTLPDVPPVSWGQFFFDNSKKPTQKM